MTVNDASSAQGRQPSAGPPSPPLASTAASQRQGFAQALAELSRGERAADKLERELHAFETKLEELLSSMGMTAADLDAMEAAGDDDAEATPPASQAEGGDDAQRLDAGEEPGRLGNTVGAAPQDDPSATDRGA
ncbi:hypothetical protein SEPCBS119000_002256 [Sporothrix epigloea]|uniref:Uncharacterized protein n=1 Tax=Sporothrix epigloea TaxID=1892477 RepID=A0ABP0DJ71_9PEZI